MSTWPSSYPFSPPRKINDVDWDLVINNITGSQIKSGSLIISTPGTTTGLSVSGITSLNVVNVSGSSVFNQPSTFTDITGSTLSIGNITSTGSQTISGDLTVGGVISGTVVGGLQTTGSIIIPSGSNLALQSGSIIPFALPATYVMFSGSISGLTGPFYVLNGNNNQIMVNGSDASSVFNSAWNGLLNGGKLFIRAGTYPIINTPTLNSINNITLEGEGGATILQLAPGISRPIISLSAAVSNLTITNLVFEGNGNNQSDASNTSLIIISSISSSNIRILNCIFQNARNSAITASSSDTLISSSKFFNNVLGNGTGAAGYISAILLTGNSTQNNIKISHNTFDSNIGCITDIDITARGVVISNNNFINNKNSTCITNNAVGDEIISNNWFYFTGGGQPPNFIALASASTIIKNNIFNGNTSQSHIYDGLPFYNIIEGNEFIGAASSAIIFTQPNNGQYEIISNNIFRLGSPGTAISVQGLNKFIICGNQLYLPFGGTALSFDAATSNNGIISNNIFGGGSIVFNFAPGNTIISGNLP